MQYILRKLGKILGVGAIVCLIACGCWMKAVGDRAWGMEWKKKRDEEENMKRREDDEEEKIVQKKKEAHRNSLLRQAWSNTYSFTQPKLQQASLHMWMCVCACIHACINAPIHIKSWIIQSCKPQSSQWRRHIQGTPPPPHLRPQERMSRLLPHALNIIPLPSPLPLPAKQQNNHQLCQLSS